jgi:leader peptidase (prepilin peptidase)/N-methyltransferase
MNETIPLVLWIILGFVMGGCIGSFLSVVITRLPKMLIREWKNDCAELTGQTPEPSPPFNLALPQSHCLSCQQRLRPWQNIPLISFWLLRGRCAFCQAGISRQYPLIEWIAAIFTACCVAYWGITPELIPPLLTLYFFIALGFIDYNEQLLPDVLTLSLLWLGLLWNLRQGQAGLAIIGAVGGYLIPWIVNRLFLWIRKKPGMGHGDFKCLAAIGAWVGLSGAIGCYVLAAIISLIVTIPLFIRKKANLASSLPFGPFLCLAGWAWVCFCIQLDGFVHSLAFP